MYGPVQPFTKLLLILSLLVLLIYAVSPLLPSESRKKPRIPPFQGKVLVYQCSRFRNNKHMMKESLSKHGGKMTPDRVAANWYLPCDYDTSDAQLEVVNKEPNWHWVGLLRRVWLLSSKRHLWTTLVRGVGEARSREIMPQSWSLPADLSRFRKEWIAGRKEMYVLKKDIHQQKGLLITENPLEVLDGPDKEGWVQIQKWQDDCLLYRGRKTNLRVWVVMIDHLGSLNTYVYQDGIISYAAQPTLSNGSAFETGVASFYSSKALYSSGYPLTLRNAVRAGVFSGIPGEWPSIWSQILDIISDVSHAVSSEFINPAKPRRIHYQTFGFDFLVDSKGKTRLIEINMGPGMEPYMDSDRTIRTDLHNCVVGLLLGVPDATNNLILL